MNKKDPIESTVIIASILLSVGHLNLNMYLKIHTAFDMIYMYVRIMTNVKHE